MDSTLNKNPDLLAGYHDGIGYFFGIFDGWDDACGNGWEAGDGSGKGWGCGEGFCNTSGNALNSDNI